MLEESAQIPTLSALVVARQSRQLAQVGQAPLAAAEAEHVQVVVAGHQRALDQLVQPVARRRPALGGEPGTERREPSRVLRRERPGQVSAAGGLAAERPLQAPPGVA